MLGGMVGKIAKWGLMAGAALVIGTQLLTSVTWVVLSIRAGDYIPLLSISILTMVLQRISAVTRSDSKLVRILLDVLAGASMVYLFFIILIGMIPLGLVLSFTGAGLVILACLLFRNPSSLRKVLKELMESAETYQGHGTSWHSSDRQNISILQMSHHAFDDAVNILKDRPMLPVVLLHLEGADFLIIHQSEEVDWVRQTKRVLQDAGIIAFNVPPLLKQLLLLLPILEEQAGFPLADYALALSEQSVSALMKVKPLRMMIFPGSDRLRIVCRRDSIPGIAMTRIPAHASHRIVIEKDGEGIQDLLDEMEGVVSAY